MTRAADKEEPPVFHLDEPEEARIDRLRRRLAGVRRQALAGLPAVRAVPFLLVTPLGLSRQTELRALLVERAIRVIGHESLEDACLAMAAVYVTGIDTARLVRALAYETLWKALYPAGRLERWSLASEADYTRLVTAKPLLRESLPSRLFHVRSVSLDFVAALHAFHVPDPAHLAIEGAALDCLLNTTNRQVHGTA